MKDTVRLSLVRGAAILATLVGFLVLAGWAFNVPALKQVLPGLASMKANAAVCYLLLGLALLLSAPLDASPQTRRTAQVLAAVASLIGLLTASEHLFGWNLGIDELLVRDIGGTGRSLPGRMPPATSAAIALLGLGLTLFQVRRERYWWVQVPALLVMTLSLFALLSYLYGYSALYNSLPQFTIALHSAITLQALGLAMLLLHPEHGPLAVVLSDSGGGLMARRLLPVALLLPLTIGWVLLLGEQSGLFSEELDTALTVVVTVLMFSVVVFITAHRLHRTSVALSRSEALFMGLYEAAPDAVLVVDSQGRIERVNAQAEREFGYSRDDLLGRPIEMLIPGRFQERHRLHRSDYVTAPRPRSMGVGLELAGLRKDGTEFPVEISLGPVQIDGQTFTMSVVRNLSERQQAAQALHESEERFRLLAEQSPVGIGMTQDGLVRYANPSMARILGYELDELIDQMSPRDLIHPDDLPIMDEQVRRRRSGEADFVHYEVRSLRRDGSHRNLEIFGGRMTFRGKPALVLTLLDVTERKQAEAAQARLAAIVESTDNAIISKTLNGFITSWNPGAERLYGYSAEEIIGKPITILVPDDLPDEIPGILAHVRRGESVVGLETRRVRRDGSIALVSLTVSPVRDASGKIVSASAIAYDISARVRAQTALRESEERFRQLSDHSPVGIVLTQDTLVRYANPAAAVIFGRSVNEMVDRLSSFDMTHPDDLEMMKEQIRRRTSGETESVHYEVRGVRPNGEIRHLEIFGTRIPYRGQPALLATVLDVTERTQAAAALRDSEERFRLLSEQAPVGIVMAQDGVIGYGNPAFAQIFGMQLEDVVGRASLTGLVHPADAPLVDEAARLRLAGEADSVRFEARALQPDGTIRNFEAFGGLITYQGRPALLSTLLDVTDRRRAEAALAASERRFRALVEKSYDAIALVDAKGVILYESPAAQRVTGFSLPDRDGRPLFQWIHPDDLPRLVQFFGQLRAAPGDSITGEFRARHHDGSWRWLAMSCTNHLDDPLVGAIVVNYSDITERRQADQALRQQRNLLQAILDNMGEAVVVVDRQQRFLVFNPAARNLLGLGPDDEPPALFWANGYDVLLPDGVTPFPKDELPLVRALRGEVADGVEFLLRRQHDGVMRSVLITGRPLLDEHNRPYGGVVVLRDITQRREIEEALRQSNAELGQFAYIASHDLQEPLRGVVGMVQLLRRRYQGKLDERADEYINHAIDGVTRMQRLIDDLLHYSRVGTRGRSFEKLELSDAVTDALANLSASLEESGAQVTIPDSLPEVMGDRTQMVQLFQNLISNALKFRAEGRRPQVRLEVETRGDEWMVSVCDNGIGIEPRFYERIFGVFQRLHSRTEYPGTGIGLAVCRKIVERHGGRLWVESQPGEGATFYFTLPEASNSDGHAG